MGIKRTKRLVTAETGPPLPVAKRLRENKTELQPPRTKEATQKLVQELEIYQIEIEEQNNELRRIQEAMEHQQVELEIQNIELKRVQEELQTTRNTYTELYDFAPVGYFTFDTAGLIRKVNLTGATLLGLDRQLLINTPFSAFIADADGMEVFSRHLETVAQQQGMHKCEVKLTSTGDTTLYGQFQSVAEDIDTKGSRINSSLVDGSVARQLSMEIQDAREYSESIVETLNRPLLVMNCDLKILTANQSFYESFKVTPEETIGNFIYDLGNRQWDIPRLRVLFEDILPNDTVFNGYEVDHVFPGIGRKSILLNARQIFRKNIGSHIILLAMEDNTTRKLIDTERARLDQVLQEKNAELERARYVADKANTAKSDFLSSMSHELRTPLGAILGFAQLMESGTPQPTASQKRSIDQILKAGWYLLELINEILDLALIESGKLSMSLEPVSLTEVMRECEVMIEPQAQKCGISVTFAHQETPHYVKADRTRAKQILINLLSNAIKYNKSDGKVDVNCAPGSAGSIRISVRDTGAGLTPQQVTQLFEPFNRLGQEAATEQGTGIGLVVCKRLVELMGGVIGVESTTGEGSVFWIELKQTTQPHIIADTGEATAAADTDVKGVAQTYTLLYVEDNPANMMLVEDLIARRPDIRFLGATDAVSGIAIARGSRPDMILMDINLPGISGIDALKILAEDPLTAHIPVVALSANAIPRDIDTGLEAGFFRYLTKPIKVKEFMDMLDVTLKYAKEEATRQRRQSTPNAHQDI